ncbi:MAG: tRNA (adenosine(37)-N6)-threonylcarbamoyltransferase complex dimerization subunit type 1 TsaB [Proteobacteria bacterium]|nr:tRNA (adenosine(37)-N6)-threonylcarbamoyltransferase complex dimerization subunit type 1 TsaB [Pseudomonadota bacterium]
MSLCFALDLSSPKGSFCAFETLPHLNVIFEKELPGTFTHSETLLNEMQSLMVDHGVRITDISKWITSSGPGSFTGLRIAYSTLKAFALATSTPLVTVEGPEARAKAFLEEQDPKTKTRPIDVLSYLTADKFVVSTFELKDKQLKKESEKIHQGSEFLGHPDRIVLSEERLGAGALYPLRSRHLRFFAELSSQREHSAESISDLSPLYFGSAHFD